MATSTARLPALSVVSVMNCSTVAAGRTTSGAVRLTLPVRTNWREKIFEAFRK